MKCLCHFVIGVVYSQFRMRVAFLQQKIQQKHHPTNNTQNLQQTKSKTKICTEICKSQEILILLILPSIWSLFFLFCFCGISFIVIFSIALKYLKKNLLEVKMTFLFVLNNHLYLITLKRQKYLSSIAVSIYLIWQFVNEFIYRQF